MHRTPFLCCSRDWRDPTWIGSHAVQNGLLEHTREQRLALFGPNLLDVAGKSTLALLVDEVCVCKHSQAVV